MFWRFTNISRFRRSDGRAVMYKDAFIALINLECEPCSG